jgi:filamentous hemagglutinin
MKLSRVVASFAVLIVIFWHTPPVIAAAYFISGFGSGFTCLQTAPCQIGEAVTEAASSAAPLEIACADGSDNGGVTVTTRVTIDCAGTAGGIAGDVTLGGGALTLKNTTMSFNGNALTLQHGILIVENVHITAASQNAILAQPSLASTLIVKNCTIEGGGAVLLKPAPGGSLSARFDHVTISGGTGGGIKIDTTNGPVTVDITNSEISSNAGNGINAVGGTGGQAIVSIKNSVIAKNGTAGVQANGATAGVLVQTTLFDQNASGATSVVAGGHISTYGNNSVVGADGSGFTGTASLR